MTAKSNQEKINTVRQKRVHSKSQEYHQKASRYIAGGVNSNVRLNGAQPPLCFQSASGSTLIDLDGNHYIDYAAGMGPTILGHAPRQLIESIASSLTDGQMYAGQSRLELDLARRLQSIVPCAGLIRLGMSGSEMVQASMRVARAYTNKSKIIKFEGHYHGWFDNVLINLSTGPDAFEQGESIPVKLQTRGQVSSVAKELAILPWNDADSLSTYLDRHADDVAGLIMEPVMCNTGVIPPAPGYLQAVRDLCDRHEVVFIMDEVITGFRLGLDGAQGYFGITPDLATYAKAFGGGFPVAAMAGKAEIMNLFSNGEVNHSGTYNSNVVSVAAGIATLEILSADNGQVYRHMALSGERLMQSIRDIAAHTGIPLRVQGYGTVFHTFFSDQLAISNLQDFKRTNAALLQTFLNALLEQGVRPTSRGTWLMTATHTEEVIDQTINAIRRAVRAL